MARTRKPIAQKKLEGTYRKDRDGNRDKSEIILSNLDTAFKEGDSLEPPANITDDFVKQHYIYHSRLLIKLHILQLSDIPELNMMYELLQRERQVERELESIDISSDIDTFERLTKLQIKLSNAFSSLSVKYYISPTARTHLELDNLELEKAKSETQSITARLLAACNKN